MKREAFTIAELLVVLATIALLMALLLPCLRISRQGAKAVVCNSNIRELVLGLTTYDAENGNFPYALDTKIITPPPGGFPGNSVYDRAGWWWFNYITDYSRKGSRRNSVLWCPSRQITDSTLNRNVLCGNYGVNLSICKSSQGSNERGDFIGTPLRATDIPHHSETMLMLDSGYSMISWWHAVDASPAPLGKTIEDTAYIPGLRINKGRSLWPGQELDAIEGRHPNKSVNVGFVDGHVTCVKADEVIVEKMGDIYRNLSPLWRPK